jgi:hypothetical protein
MRRALCVLFLIAACAEREEPARPKLVEARPEPVAAAALPPEPMRRDWEGPGDDWDRAFVIFSESKDRSAEIGAYSVERAKDASVSAWRRLEQVSGDAFAQLRDAALVTQVKAKLAADEDTRLLPVTVDADDHTVELAGKVRSAADAARVVRLALATPGTERVISKLTW